MHNVYASFTHPIRLPPKSTVNLGPEEMKDYNKQIHDLKFIRGHFLELIICIEERINLLLETSLISKKSKLKNVFQEKILHSRNTTLKSKIDLLKEIIKTKKEMKDSDLNEFYKSLELLIIERNKWAHGPIFFQQKNVNGKLKMQSYLNYINSEGKFAEQELNDQYFDNLNKELNIINERLISILVKRKLLPKEYLKQKDKN